MAKFKVRHLNRQIPPLAHTSMYVWHKYWSRKTWNVVREYIKSYCPENGIVLDPFAGSGVVAMEALKNGRRAIVCDLLPIATEITRLTIKPTPEVHIYDAFKRVATKVKRRIEKLYTTTCRNCGKKIVFDCAVWSGDKCVEIRYQLCPFCSDRQEVSCRPNKYDKDLLKKISRKNIKEWYPKNTLYYPDGRPFKKKEHYESVDELFNDRSLQCLAWLMEAIEEEPKRILRDFLKIAFSSMVHLCSRMIPVSNPSPTSHHTAFSSTGWIQHSYWSAPMYMEQNVWNKFESAIDGHQGLFKAKAESNKVFKDVKFATALKQFLSGEGDVYIYTGSCLDLMKRIPERSIDYVFTDPPYDASVQFGELSYMWVSWLKMNNNYIENISADEVIRNENQHKDFGSYYALLSSSFQKMFEVLKPGSYLTLTFHNPTFKVRNATIRAGIFSGFDFEKIFHQPLGQVSAKAMAQPFGSAQGDFYLRFKKPEKAATGKPEEIDEVRFENIVVETTIGLLAERAEPTPYTVIINYIDPVLAKHGFFGSLHTGLDVKKVLKKHLGKEFVLLPVRIGKTKGKLWWFKDTSIVPRLNEVPLSERVEQTVYRKLLKAGKVDFTDVWDAVSTEFPNSLTSDSTSIKSALEIYASKVSGGYWLLKPDIRQRVREHSEMIAMLATIGKRKGFDVWVGKREQSDKAGRLFKNKPLSQIMTVKKLKADNATNQSVIENIDVLWLKGKKIEAVFEVESTTSMTSALLRGSNIDRAVRKYMVLPEEREGQLNNKLTSPLFKEHFENENWKVVYFDALRMMYLDKKGKIGIEALANIKAPKSKKGSRGLKQTSLFERR